MFQRIRVLRRMINFIYLLKDLTYVHKGWCCIRLNYFPITFSTVRDQLVKGRMGIIDLCKLFLKSLARLFFTQNRRARDIELRRKARSSRFKLPLKCKYICYRLLLYIYKWVYSFILCFLYSAKWVGGVFVINIQTVWLISNFLTNVLILC